MKPEQVLAWALGITVVLLALAVLVGIATGQRDLSEMGSRALTVGIAAAAGTLGYRVGKDRQEP